MSESGKASLSIRFSIDQGGHDAIKALAREGESVHQAARRLALAATKQVKRYVLYETRNADSATFCYEGDLKELLPGMDEGAREVWHVFAFDWEEAMQLYYDHMGWGKYEPITDKENSDGDAICS